MAGLYYLIFNETLPQSVQQEDIKAAVQNAIKAVEEAAAAPVKLANAPSPKKNPVGNYRGIAVFILLLLAALGFVFVLAGKTRHKRRSKRRLMS